MARSIRFFRFPGRNYVSQTMAIAEKIIVPTISA